MPTIVNQFDAKVDAKKRISLRNAQFDYYHAEVYDDGRIVLSPRVLTDPFQVSEKTLETMDRSMENFKEGKVYGPVDLSAFGE